MKSTVGQIAIKKNILIYKKAPFIKIPVLEMCKYECYRSRIPTAKRSQSTSDVKRYICERKQVYQMLCSWFLL